MNDCSANASIGESSAAASEVRPIRKLSSRQIGAALAPLVFLTRHQRGRSSPPRIRIVRIAPGSIVHEVSAEAARGRNEVVAGIGLDRRRRLLVATRLARKS